MTVDWSNVAIIDTETTGLDPERHHIWEIAVIVDDREYCWQQLWFGGWEAVDIWVLENTGIRERFDPKKAMHPIPSLRRFIDLVRNRHLIGACPWFDSERLHRAMLDWSEDGLGTDRALPWHYHLIDVETLAVGWLAGRGYEPPALPWDSNQLSRFVGIDPDDFQPKHSALADARWAKAIYERIAAS